MRTGCSDEPEVKIKSVLIARVQPSKEVTLFLSESDRDLHISESKHHYAQLAEPYRFNRRLSKEGSARGLRLVHMPRMPSSQIRDHRIGGILEVHSHMLCLYINLNGEREPKSSGNHQPPTSCLQEWGNSAEAAQSCTLDELA